MLCARALATLRRSLNFVDTTCLAQRAFCAHPPAALSSPPAPEVCVVDFPTTLAVKAYYVGEKIDIYELYQLHQQRKILRRDCVILYSPFIEELSGDIKAAPEEASAQAPPTKTHRPPPPPIPVCQQLEQDEGIDSDKQLEASSSTSDRKWGSRASLPTPQANLPWSLSSRGVQHDDPLQDGGIMVVHRFGSVTFFGVRDVMHWQIIRVLLSDVTAKPIPMTIIAEEGTSWTRELEEHEVKVEPNLREWVEKREDIVCIQRLDLGTLELIALCMGQSIALKYYNWLLNATLQQLNKLRGDALALQGSTNLLDVLRSYPMLGRRITTDDLAYLVIGFLQMRLELAKSLQLLDRNPLAWHLDRYDNIWELLKDEFELEHRHSVLRKKLSFTADETKYDTGSASASVYDRMVNTVIVLLVLGLLAEVWELYREWQEEA